MRLPLLATLQLFAVLGGAFPTAPEFGPFGRAIASVSELGSDAESATNVLSRGWDHSSQPFSSNFPQQQGGLGFPPHILGSGNSFRHSLTSPFKALAGFYRTAPPHDTHLTAPPSDFLSTATPSNLEAPGSSVPLSPNQQDVHGASFLPLTPVEQDPPGTSSVPLSPAQQNLDGTVASQIDFQLPHWLRDRTQHDWIGLPTQLTYVRSPWLSKIYQQFVSTLPRYKRATNYEEVQLSDQLIGELLSRKRNIFKSNGNIYKVEVPDDWLQVAEIDHPVELLVRFHQKLNWVQQGTTRSVTFWSTADRGTKLALLGSFHIPWNRQWDLLDKFTKVERFNIHKLLVGDGESVSAYGERFYLEPKALKESQPSP
ncbi:uncharacterized protein SPSC_03542 [Sporisorium scitamineum]|uniref:Effector family protein Eff1 n=1 Tax=Sporisorium scitamineum TaxID=49012 RepID=A0A140KN51_9BASI|nr:uncharacterized protein SPSC_03542 [Sporisorium scitamineum]